MRLKSITCLAVLLVAVAPVRADEAPYARAYLEQINTRLSAIEDQMPAITRAADFAAEALTKGKGLGVRGDAGMANELSNRAGALMGYDGRAGEAGDVILYVFGLLRTDGPDPRALLVRQVDEADRLTAKGSVVIGLGSVSQLRSYGMLDEANGACAVLLDNAAPAVDGLFFDHDGKAIVPTATVLNAAAAWAFQCEVFSALTRLDKVPVVRQSFEIDTLHKRWRRYGSQRFHHDRWLDPVAPGELGEAYLDGLREVLLDIGTASWRDIAQTARRSESALADGGTVWLRAGGRYLPYHAGGQLAADPGVFRPLSHDGSDPRLASPGVNDYVIAVGDSETAGGWRWGEPELLRNGGRGTSWIVNRYNTQRHDLAPGEVLVDLWGHYAGGVVKVNNYDTRLGPTTAVAGEAVFWMIVAEVVGSRNERE